MISLDRLHRAVKRLDDFADIGRDALEPMRVRGVAHDHILARRTGAPDAVLRVPRFSQWDQGPEENLAYQAAAFERAEASGRTPRLLAVLPVSDALPMGALVVEAIAGQKPRLPDHLADIADCLARIHRLPVPAADARAPLRVHENPVGGLMEFIELQAASLPAADLEPGALSQLEDEIAWARGFAAGWTGTSPLTLIGTDTHPGNFLISDRGAVFVDLEKALYGSPAVDIAHASLYTSTMWDPDCAAALDAAAVEAFHQAYFSAAGSTIADALQPIYRPVRRLVWLRTMTWCAKWRAAERQAPGGSGKAGLSRYLDSEHRRHLRRILKDYFAPDQIARMRHALT